ncbi:flagellar biosynthetic protein FliO [Shinella yambaruensis]|uniref:Histidine kinase n=1 Tax=Shinella yambaruensis TaxID=415996 RepID=A0ABQ5ZBA2_9HYPH|nr:flagellar biosynthetic protein FliO [Shinella yambaruensis]MCJ8028359.1 flagellar biosynthetic protein FliO [Shinella yambaruensis]MCU7980159.1 flagellar biosynthetic protein FliO [Shinella yambaruensis]GLR49326.1 histidine kinase [Shinella yambaruensis]
MFQEILAENGTKFVIAAVVVLLGLLCLALVLWIIRGRPSSPFIRGGRNRAPRLAVLDAAAIDTRRRLVLVRRDDVEHLLMIGGPTDIVIETRIALASAESAQPAAERAGQKTERAESAPVRHETPVKTAETLDAARTAASAGAVAATTGTAERRPAATPEGVSSMAKVLYAGDEDVAPRTTPAQTVAQPVQTAQQAQTGLQQRPPERRIEDVLEQNRQRVLPQSMATTTAQATAGQAVQRPIANPTLAKPTSQLADNPALVSEFEKILEAEMASTAASSTTARTAAQPTLNPTQTAATIGHGQTPAKSREETEAEMARLLGEITANRKA